MTPSASLSNPRRQLYWLATGHGLHDIFTGIWVIVLTAQRDALNLSYTEVGIITMFYTLSTAVAQPTLGHYFDRTGKPYQSLWTIATTALMVMLAAVVGNFWLLLLAGVGAGVSSAGFHAAGLGNAKQLAAGRGNGTATAIFLVVGNAGFALGQPLAGMLLDWQGVSALTIPLVACLFGAPFIVYRLQSALNQPPNRPTRTSMDVLRGDSKVWLPVIAFTGLVFANQAFNGGMTTYLPQFYEAQGSSLTYAGNLSGLLFLFAAFGSLVGGTLSDYISRRALGIGSMILVAPLTFLTLRADGALVIGLSMVLGLLSNISLPILLLIGQEVLPGGKTGAGGYAFGMTFFARGLLTPVVGVMGDVFDLLTALTVIGCVPLIFAGLFLLLPAQPTSDML